MSALFDPQFYLSQYPDVAEAVRSGVYASAEEHFLAAGQFENRAPSPFFDPNLYLVANPDVAQALRDGLIDSAFAHLSAFGLDEDRDQSAFFDAEFYLTSNPDIAAAVAAGETTAFRHFVDFGLTEARSASPFFDVDAYLASSPDVADAVQAGTISAYQHFTQFGVQESRDLGNGISLAFFASDPVAQNALANGDFAGAIARVAEIAPFVPGFEAPAGYSVPADQRIPTDFVPNEGAFLVVPEGVTPSADLPPAFEQPTEPPVEPEPPVTPEPPITPSPTVSLDLISGGSVNATEATAGIVISGGTTGLAEGRSITVVVGDKELLAEVDAKGGFSVNVLSGTLSALEDGDVSVSAFVTDRPTVTAAGTFLLDTAPPGAAVLTESDPVAEGSLTISGRGEIGATIEFAERGQNDPVSLAIEEDGSWTYQVTSANGPVTVTVIDAAGNRGESQTLWLGTDQNNSATFTGTGADYIFGLGGDDTLQRGASGNFEGTDPIFLVGGAGSDVLTGSSLAVEGDRPVIMFGGELTDMVDGVYGESSDTAATAIADLSPNAQGSGFYTFLSGSKVDTAKAGNIFQPLGDGDTVVASDAMDVIAFFINDAQTNDWFDFFKGKTFNIHKFDVDQDGLVFSKVGGPYVDFREQMTGNWDSESGVLTLDISRAVELEDTARVTINFLGVQNADSDEGNWEQFFF